MHSASSGGRKKAGAHPERKRIRGFGKTADFKPATFHRFRTVAETPPHPSASEVRRFLRKRHVRRLGLPQRSVHRRHGPLGDQSLPRKSSDYIWVAENPTSPKRLRGRAISPKAPRPQTRTTAEIGPPQTRTAQRSVPLCELETETTNP